MEQRTAGVSVVLPTHRGATRIAATLESLARQALNPSRCEVVVVEHGTDDGTRWLVASLARTHPRRRFRYVHLAEAGVAEALDHGIAAAAHTHVTFVEDGDVVPEGYLTALWKLRQDAAIAVGYVAVGPGELEFDNDVVRALVPFAGRRIGVDQAPTAVVRDAAALLPTEYAGRHRFAAAPFAGFEVAPWFDVAVAEGLDLVVAPPDTQAVYHRTRRGRGAVGPDDYAQEIEARAAVIARLAPSARRADTPPGTRAARRAIRAQVSAMNRFLTQFPQFHGPAVATLEDVGVEDVVPWDEFTRGRARRLAISYCFPPAADTSAMVAARRVAGYGACVDLVSHSMKRIAGRDASMGRLTRPHVDRRWTVNGPAAALSWDGGVKHFIDRGWEHITRENPDAWPYTSLYSRAMWPASHLLAALAHLEHPGMHWTAEMSDPLSINTTGQERDGDWDPDDPLVVRFRAAVAERGFAGPDSEAMAPWIETVAYALADEILFTNAVQRDFMLGRIADPPLREHAAGISVVAAHPRPPERFYREQPPLELPTGVVNIGYFGNFYPNRGLGDLFTALNGFDRRSRVRVHVFTNRPGDLSVQVTAHGLDDQVEVHPQLPYLEYLPQLRRFEVLLVNDADAVAYLGVNPYLPSKVSDYLGSGSDIWAMVEPGSPMDGLDLTFVSSRGDADSAAQTLAQIVDRHA